MFETHKRIVIKVGSALLRGDEYHPIRREWMASLATDMAELHKQGTEVILVSSGAVALGRPVLNLTHHNVALEEKQAAAAAGQGLLMQEWREALSSHTIDIAQILLTIDDTDNRRRYLNARNTVDVLLQRGVVPIINENDSVATAEIRYGDNDRLAARVAAMASADLLILLSDIDGLYTTNPQLDATAEHIPTVHQLTENIMAMGGDSTTDVGSGGMITKLQAAKMATASGCHMLIANGKELHPLRRIQEGERHTHFTSDENPLSARKHWIASQMDIGGSIIIDDGAVKALQAGGSLLAVGIREVSGAFEKGDTVTIRELDHSVIARGLIGYNAQDTALIAGKQSDETPAILGYHGSNEVIHRDDLVME